jgi:hypothetical protein
VVTEFEYDEFMAREMKLKTLKFDDYNDELLDFAVLNRRNRADKPARDYNIVEGPVAMDGKISREEFMSELVYNTSHQICFCTVHSLHALTPTLPKRRIHSVIFHIGDEVVQSLMIDYGLTEDEAADLYYSSQTYAAVADESTGYYQKPWQEIYEMLRAELKI